MTTTIQDNDALLIYRVGPVLCCSPCLPVSTIILPPELTQLPGQHGLHSGIFKHHHNLIRVCECRHSFGVEQPYWVQPGRIIITSLAIDCVGFWVDKIIDVIKWPQTGWGKPPPLIPAETFSRTLLLNDQIHLYCEFEKLNALQQIGFLKNYIATLIREQEKKSTASVTQVQQQTPGKSANQHKLTTTTINSRTFDTLTEAENTQQQTPKPDFSIKSESLMAHASQVTKIKTSALQHNKLKTKNNIKKIKSVTLTKPTLTTILQHSKTKTNKTYTSNHRNKIHKKPIISHQYAKAPQPRPKSDRQTTAASTSAQSKNYQQQKQPQQNNTQASAALKITSLLFFIFSSCLLVYYFLEEKKSITKTTSNIITLNSTTSNSHDLTQTKTVVNTPNKIPPNEQQTVTQIEVHPAQSIVATSDQYINKNLVASNTVSKNDITNTPAAAATIVTSDTKINDSAPHTEQPMLVYSDTENQTSVYHAEISKDQQGITIVLHSPSAEQPLEQTFNTSNLADTATTMQNEANVNTDNAEKSTSVLSQRVINYIVIKGDTLWDIATFYVHNPYRYPELARLSKINNPDLIYPGDRVRIILIYSNEQKRKKYVGRPRNRK